MKFYGENAEKNGNFVRIENDHKEWTSFRSWTIWQQKRWFKEKSLYNNFEKELVQLNGDVIEEQNKSKLENEKLKKQINKKAKNKDEKIK